MSRFREQADQDVNGEFSSRLNNTAQPPEHIYKTIAIDAQERVLTLTAALKYTLLVRNIKCHHPAKGFDPICANCVALAAINPSLEM
jgi:hypothetical protein